MADSIFTDDQRKIYNWVPWRFSPACSGTLASFTSSSFAFNPYTGQTINFTASVPGANPADVVLTIAGNIFTGTAGLAWSWDGKYPSGVIVPAGTYTATLSYCGVSKTIDITVGSPPKKKSACEEGSLEQPSGSTTNLMNGALSHGQELFATSGAQLSTSIQLFYNSLSNYNGPLGLGWTHNYDITLSPNSDNSVYFRKGNGERQLITLSGSTYESPLGEHFLLEKNGDGSFTITYRDGQKQHFGIDGKITSAVDRHGNSISFSYEGGDLTTITDSSHRITKLDYYTTTTPHRIRSITDPALNVYQFVYQGNNLWKVTNPSVETPSGTTQGYWEYTYNTENGLLRTKRDSNNNTTQYSYYSDHRMQNVIDPEGTTNPAGHTRTFVYNDEASEIRTTTFTDKNGGIWTNIYDTRAGVLKKKIAPDPATGAAGGKATSYYYYADGSLKAKTEPFGTGNPLTTFYTYDANGNLLTETEPVDLSVYTNPTVDPETYDVTKLANLTPPINWAFSYTYETHNNNDLIKSKTDLRGTTPLVTSYNYDYTTEPGVEIVKITDPENHVTTYRYNADGTLKSVIDARNVPQTFTYENGLLASVTDQDRVITKYTIYDNNGNPKQIQKLDNTGNLIVTTDLTYDALNRLRTVTKTTTDNPPIITVANYDYDLMGNLTVYTDPETTPTVKQTKYEYNFNGQVTKITDADQKETHFSYSGTGCTSCSGGVDKLTGVQDAKQLANNWPGTTYFYDKLGRLERETDPRGKTIRYTYYDNGLMKNKIDGSATPEKVLISYEYNRWGQLTKKQHASGFSDMFEYDANGRLWKASNPNIFYTLEWYKNGRLKSITDNTLKSVSYSYDGVGNRIRMTAPDGITYYTDFDQSNRPYWLYTPAGIFYINYDSSGRQQKISWGWSGNPAITYNYDGLNQISNIQRTDNLGQVLASIGYSYDRSGNRLSRTEPSKSSIYEYDNLYRLKSVTTDGLLAENYTYDEVGNRTSGSNAAVSYVYSQGNQLDSQNGVTYQYDDYGNLTKKIQGTTTYSYVYDDGNRLTRVEKKIGAILSSTTTFDYDPFGRRIKRRVLKGTTETINRYVYDGDNILYEYDGTGQFVRRITHSPGSIDFPIAYNTGTDAYYYFGDALGSVNFISDQNGTAVAEYSYDSFGSPIKTRLGSMPQPYSYTGREYDIETGLYYYRARYYDPKAGRFIQRDPIGFAGGDVNLYGYVQNNPINFVDPDGLSAVGAVINFTKKSWNHIVKRHVNRNTFPGKSKFSKPSSIEKNARRTVSKPGKTTCQSNGNTLYEKDFGRTVGTNGETVQRVVVDEYGNVVTTFPSSSITAAGIIGLIGSMLDPFDLISGGLADDGSDMF